MMVRETNIIMNFEWNIFLMGLGTLKKAGPISEVKKTQHIIDIMTKH